MKIDAAVEKDQEFDETPEENALLVHLTSISLHFTEGHISEITSITNVVVAMVGP